MRFWDTSALLPLFIVEEKSSAVRPLLNDDPDVLVWALTPVELVSAISRRVPAEHDSRQRQAAAEIVMAAQSSWIKVRTYEEVAALAYEVCEKHRLRAGDALQLLPRSTHGQIHRRGPSSPSTTTSPPPPVPRAFRSCPDRG